jgi:hypothetical protein
LNHQNILVQEEDAEDEYDTNAHIMTANQRFHIGRGRVPAKAFRGEHLY